MVNNSYISTQVFFYVHDVRFKQKAYFSFQFLIPQCIQNTSHCQNLDVPMCMGILTQHKVVKLSNPNATVFHNKLHRSGFIWIKLIAI